MTDASNQEWSENHHALLELLKEWWNPPDELIATLPKGGISLKYLGHSDTSRALTECDPFWSWEPMGYTDDGQPFLTLNERGSPSACGRGLLSADAAGRVTAASCRAKATPSKS